MKKLEQILFIDIETVPIVPNFYTLSENRQLLWEKKANFFKNQRSEPIDIVSSYNEKAGIFAEFAKVVCIGIGCMIFEKNKWILALKVIKNEDEKILLNDFFELLNRFEKRVNNFHFCGHNIKEFDLPFLCRRTVINEMQLPNSMNLSGKKPWEVEHEDTMELWSFGDRKNYTSLALIAEVLNIPSSKTEMDGSQVAHVFWEEHDLEKIGNYCRADVEVTAKIYMKLKGLGDIINDTKIYQDD